MLISNLSSTNIFNSSVNKLSEILDDDKEALESNNDSLFFKLIDDKKFGVDKGDL